MKEKYKNKKELERILKEVVAGKLTKIEAALITGYTRQHIYWLEKRYKEEGVNGLIHKNTGRSPANKIGDDTKTWVVEQYKTWCTGFNFKLFQRKLKEKTGRTFSYHFIHDTLRAAGVVPPVPHKVGKKNEHPSRPRKEREGELVQIDATPYQWFKKWGDTTYYALHGAIDDATGKVVGMYMTQNECSHGYFELLRQIFTHYGKPIAFYSDRSAIFHPTNKAKLSIEEQLEGRTRPRTHWEKIMEDLNTTTILANSPQAKGRVERMWGTHQQDLLFDIQDKGLKTVDEVNAYLPTYIAKFNSAFSIAQSGEGVAWRKAGQHWDDKICKRYPRVVDMGNCVSFMNYRLQVDTPLKRNAKVEIRVAENKLWARVNDRNYSVHLIGGTKQQDMKVRKMINLCLFSDEKCG